MPRRIDRDAKRQHLLDAAVRVFAAHGYAAATMDAVATAAGVSKAQLYLYFDGKDALFFAAFSRFAETVRADLTNAAAGAGPADRRLRAIATAWGAAMARNRALLPIVLEFWAAAAAGPNREIFAATLHAAYEEARTTVACVLADGRAAGAVAPDAPVDALATAFVGALDGLFIQIWLDPSRDPEGLATVAVDAFLDGLPRPPA